MKRRDVGGRSAERAGGAAKAKRAKGAATSAAPGDPSARALALRVMTMPKDTNPYGTVFGGVILSIIDQAGFVHARRHGGHRWVTVALDAVEFKRPVHLGDVVAAYARTLRTGRTSVTVEVEVEAERFSGHETVAVTAARLTMVCVDETGRAVPFAG
ncbi:hypothetical protein BH11PLA1_BH11PLA1_00570 [soil metagenome]